MSTSYSSPVSELLTFGDCRDFREWPNYLDLGLGPEHVPELIEMATDEELNWADSESLEVWAPVHAWRALGQLRAVSAVEPLLRLFHELDDSDWVGEELPQVYGMIGREAIPALARYLDDASHGLWPRVTAATSLERIAAGDPSARDECVSVLSRQLERFTENDPILNGFLISYLVTLRAVEAAPLMERAFAADRVDLSIPGDWEDVQVELGLKATRETPRTYGPLFPMLDAPERDESHQRANPEKAAAKKKKAKRKQARASRKKNRKRR
jgi:Protein of unknown function (DUF1186)